MLRRLTRSPLQREIVMMLGQVDGLVTLVAITPRQPRTHVFRRCAPTSYAKLPIFDTAICYPAAQKFRAAAFR